MLPQTKHSLVAKPVFPSRFTFCSSLPCSVPWGPDLCRLLPTGPFASCLPGGLGHWEMVAGDRRVHGKCGQGACSARLPPCWVAGAWLDSWVHPFTKDSRSHQMAIPRIPTALLWASGSGNGPVPSFFLTVLASHCYFPWATVAPLVGFSNSVPRLCPLLHCLSLEFRCAICFLLQNELVQCTSWNCVTCITAQTHTDAEGGCCIRCIHVVSVT